MMLPDGHTLAVCNGGIRTHPDFPRAKLNLATMRPSLAYIDRHKGRLIAEARWPDDRHPLSIRHLDVAPDGTVAFGMQYKGPKGNAMPLELGRASSKERGSKYVGSLGVAVS